MPAETLSTATSEGKWYTAFSRYETPSVRKAAWQLSNTVIPYLGLWGVMVVLVRQGYPYWATLVLTVPAAALLMRIFIFFHDCCHGCIVWFATGKFLDFMFYYSFAALFTDG